MLVRLMCLSLMMAGLRETLITSSRDALAFAPGLGVAHGERGPADAAVLGMVLSGWEE